MIVGQDVFTAGSGVFGATCLDGRVISDAARDDPVAGVVSRHEFGSVRRGHIQMHPAGKVPAYSGHSALAVFREKVAQPWLA